MDIDLTDKFLALQKGHKPAIGRYSISSLWGVLNGFISPEDWFKGEEITLESALRMGLGTKKHEMIEELLEGYEIEKKTEFAYKDFILVGKCDATKDNTILEIKTSDKLIPQAKRWHSWQLKCYLSMFGKDEGFICQPVFSKTKFYLKDIGRVERNEKWFKLELEKIDILHQKLLKWKNPV